MQRSLVGQEQGRDSGEERAAPHRVRARRLHLLRDAVRLRSDERQQEGLRGHLRRIDHPHTVEVPRRRQDTQHRGRADLRRVRETSPRGKSVRESGKLGRKWLSIWSVIILQAGMDVKNYLFLASTTYECIEGIIVNI